MFNVTRLIHTSDPDRLLPEVRALAVAADRAVVQPTLPGVRNGGDILMHLRFDTEDQWRSVEVDFAATLTDSAVTLVNGACYSGDASSRSAKTGTVYRALLLRVLPGTDTDTVARFEHELRLMACYVKTITAWQLSRVDEAVGSTQWTHVFEQEFTDVGGLMGPYLMHPIHWAMVDRWFDPECPEVIIRDRVCHSFCAITDSALT
jgi:hypothetical protein